MSEKFDPKHTPKTNLNKFHLSELEILEGSEVPVVETWFAEELERRARIAEARLEIIFGNFKAFQEKHGDAIVVSLAVEALLNCIEREFELRGLK